MIHQPHVCNHGDGLIEWCECALGEDHPSDHPRIAWHPDPERDKSKQKRKYPPGHWGNPVTQEVIA